MWTRAPRRLAVLHYTKSFCSISSTRNSAAAPPFLHSPDSIMQATPLAVDLSVHAAASEPLSPSPPEDPKTGTVELCDETRPLLRTISFTSDSISPRVSTDKEALSSEVGDVCPAMSPRIDRERKPNKSQNGHRRAASPAPRMRRIRCSAANPRMK